MYESSCSCSSSCILLWTTNKYKYITNNYKCIAAFYLNNIETIRNVSSCVFMCVYLVCTVLCWMCTIFSIHTLHSWVWLWVWVRAWCMHPFSSICQHSGPYTLSLSLSLSRSPSQSVNMPTFRAVHPEPESEPVVRLFCFLIKTVIISQRIMCNRDHGHGHGHG